MTARPKRPSRESAAARKAAGTRLSAYNSGGKARAADSARAKALWQNPAFRAKMKAKLAAARKAHPLTAEQRKAMGDRMKTQAAALTPQQKAERQAKAQTTRLLHKAQGVVRKPRAKRATR